MQGSNRSIGIFGGTFDPVHCGHLQIALELNDYLGLSALHMIPSALPPHRDRPATSAEHRHAMLQLALANEPALIADNCELSRSGVSYTIDTVKAFRKALGGDTLCLCIGMDALLGLNSWHRWQDLLDYAHIVVATRPGWQLPDDGEVVEFVRRHRVELSELAAIPCGKLVIAELSLLSVSATAVRRALLRNESIRGLVPDAVIDYIEQHGLYQGH